MIGQFEFIIYTLLDGLTYNTRGYFARCGFARVQGLYISETGCTLIARFGEHLRSITKNMPGFPVAEHFNNNGHSFYDSEVRGIKHHESNKQRKRQEMPLIFKIGTSQPHGLNPRCYLKKMAPGVAFWIDRHVGPKFTVFV